MFLVRKIGKVLRGAATPLQVQLACVLGTMLGFAPGFSRAPALVLGIVLLFLILNANLGLFLLVAGVAKLASLALMPVSFAAGRLLLDGPTRPLFVKAINAPVLAFAGLEWYVGAGGLLVGLVLGIALGLLVGVLLRRFRAAMANFEDASGFYQRNKGNPLVRFVFWLFFGPRHGWGSYRDLLGRRFGMPIRISGVIVAALVVGTLWLAASRLTEPLLRTSLKDGLEVANGATVDVGRVELDLGGNRLAVRDLAMADREELDRDLFRATLLEGDLSGLDLLRKRLKLDRVAVSDALHGAKREKPGVRIGPDTDPSEPPPTTDPDEKTIEDWLATAKEWKERLKQAKEWLDKLKREPTTAPEDEPTLRDRLEKEVEAKGWRNVAATHLIVGAPLFHVGELVVEGMRSERLEGRLIDLRAENLSTNPGLVDAPPRITLKTRDDALAIDVALGSEARVPGQSSLTLRWAGIPAAAIAQPIEAKTGVKTLEGGTIDAGFHLAWGAGGVAAFDTPLDVKVKDSTIHVPKAGPARVKEVAIPLLARGPLDNPRVKLELGRLAENLTKAGAAALGDQLKAEAEKKASELESKAKSKLEDEAKKALEGLNPFDRKKKKDEKKDGGN